MLRELTVKQERKTSQELTQMQCNKEPNKGRLRVPRLWKEVTFELNLKEFSQFPKKEGAFQKQPCVKRY